MSDLGRDGCVGRKVEIVEIRPDEPIAGDERKDGQERKGILSSFYFIPTTSFVPFALMLHFIAV